MTFSKVNRHSLVASFLLLLSASVIILSGIRSASAVTVSTNNRTTEMKRLRMSYLDVINASNIKDPNGTCGGLAKRVVLDTIPAGGQVNSIVTKVRTAFNGPLVSQIGVIAVRAEQGGVQVSNGDIATPHTNLQDTIYIENRIPTVGEYAFYDEDASWQVVAYICGSNTLAEPLDISSLTQGSVDFYAIETNN